MGSLRERRNANLLNRAFRRLAKRGKHPKFSAVFDMLARLAGRSDEGSMLEPAKFATGAPFPLDDFNKNLEDIAQEFQILYDEAVFRASRTIESQVAIEEFVSELRRQLLQIRENTQRELLLAASNFLDAIVIQFVNRNNIDETNTTADVDTEAGLVTLPRRAGARRVVPPVMPEGPSDIESQDNDLIVIKGSEFRSVFTDALANWQARSQGNWIRVRSDLGGKVKIGRIQVSSPDDQALLEVRISPDGINFIRVGDPRVIRGGVVNFLFESQDVRHIELIMTKTVPAETDGVVFTLDSIAMYSVGYQTEAVLQTTALQSENGDDIKRATLDVDADIPEETYLNLEVAGGSSDFRPVENRIIDFTDNKKNDVFRRALSADVDLVSYSSILGARGFTTGGSPNTGIGYNDVWGIPEADFFGNTSIPSNIDSRSPKLYRENCWGVEQRVTNDVKKANVRMSMEYGEIRPLYVKLADQVVENGSSLTNTITVTRDIATGANMPLAQSEDASIVKVTGFFNHGRWPVPSVGPFPEFFVTIHVEGNGPNKEVYTEDTLAGTPDYVEDYQTVFIDGVGDVEIVDYDSSTRRIDLDPTIDIQPGTYTLRLTKRDLTRHVSAINGRDITFTVQLREYEKIVITYNTPVDGTRYELIASSVEVKSSIDSSVTGVEGSDYNVIGESLEIPQGTSLPTDGGGSTAHVPADVSFKYILKEPNVFSYWAYVVVPEGQNRVIKITPIDLQYDEKVLWADPSGRTVDMAGLDTLVLTAGVHRFSVIGVRGINDDDVIDQDSALYQLVNLTAADGGYVFDPNAQYIERITGYLEPMSVTSRFFLERQAKKDNNTHFAWEDNIIMSVLRLDLPDDAVTMEPGNNSLVGGADYRLQYRYYNSDGVDSVKIKATLRRDPSADPGKTPVIRGLTVRFTE